MPRAANLAAFRLNLPSNYYDYVAYAAMHLACLGVFWVGISWRAVAICLLSYFFRMFGLVAGYHRYFAHRTYKMSRPMQFLMALLGSLAVQKGVLWWSEYHRHHHRFPDEPEDVHSPITRSFAYSHSGWFLDRRHRNADFSKVRDLAAYPELRWLNNWNLIPVVLYAAALFFALGWEGLIWGFFVSTILIWHAIHSIGSFGHRFGGYRRYPTTDNSRNKWFLAIVTLGEGWHNNHHYYPASARQGFFWYEYDIAYGVLKILSWLRLVKDLKTPPEHVRRGKLMPGYLRRLKAFQIELMDLRRRLESLISEELGLASGRGEGHEIGVAFREWTASRVDLFDEAAYNLVVQGPLEMAAAFKELHGDIREMVRTRLTPAFGSEIEERVTDRVYTEFKRFSARPEFLGRAVV